MSVGIRLGDDASVTPALDDAEATQQVEHLIASFPIFDLTPMVVLEALRGVRDHQLLTTMRKYGRQRGLNQVPMIFSEDFNSNSTLEGVRFVNPFAFDFALENWG